MTSKRVELIKECQRQSESCLYSSTTLFIWLRCLRIINTVFVTVPLVLGSFAGWQLVTYSSVESIKFLVAGTSFIAGLLPTIYSALKFDDYLANCTALAGTYKNLQDQFRFAALVSSKNPISEFDLEVRSLYSALERARQTSFTAPEWCFRSAQRKIDQGDYKFEVDVSDIAEADSTTH